MRATYRLTASEFRQTVDLPFMAAAIVVNNPTASPIYVRIGATDWPTASNADLIVPAAQSQSYPIQGRTFALVMADPTLLAGTASATAGLFQACVVTLIDPLELVPAYGSASYLSLSTSDLSGGAVSYSGVTTTPTYDLGPWGGAMLFVSPAVGTGQSVVQVLVSANGTTFYSFGVWALWPGNPAMLLIPRTLRYVSFVFNQTAIPGEPAIGGVFNVRGTLAEVFQAQFTPIGNGIARVVTVPQLSTVSNYFVTANLPAVSLRWQGTSGNPLGQATWYTGPTASGPWSVVAYREQVMGGSSASLYRSIGNLDLFLRVDILDLDVTAGGFVGTLTMSVSPEQDLTSYEQLIFAALGDVQSGAPNVNQSIYHELDNIRLVNNTMDTRLASINTIESQNNVFLSQINQNVADSEVYLQSIATTNTNIANGLTRTARQYGNGFPSAGAGIFTNSGIDLPVGLRIGEMQAFCNTGVAVPIGTVAIALGTAAVPTFTVYSKIGRAQSAGGSTSIVGDPSAYSSLYFGGLEVLSGFTRVWVMCTVNGTLGWQIIGG